MSNSSDSKSVDLKEFWIWIRRNWLNLLIGLFFITTVPSFIYFNTGYIVDSDLYQVVSTQSLQIRSPKYLPYSEGSAAEVFITLTTDTALTTPYTLTLTLPTNIVISDTLTMLPNGKLSVVFPAITTTSISAYHISPDKQTQTQSLFIKNAKINHGKWLYPKFFEQTTITTEGYGTPIVRTPIKVETAWGHTFNKFLNTDVSERSPFILILGALFALIAWVYKEKQEKERKQEKKKTQEKKRTEELFNNIRKAFRQTNTPQAREIFNQLRTIENAKKYINSNDILYVEQLLKVAENGGDSISNIVHTSRWRAEIIGILIALWKSQSINQPIEFLTAIQFIKHQWNNSSADIPDTQWNELITIEKQWRDILQLTKDKRKEIDVSLKQKNDTAQNRKGETSMPWRPHRHPSPIVLKNDPSTIRKKLQYSPFESIAENDSDNLFGEIGGFWNEHPVYQKIANSTLPQIIVGNSGSGKTTFAKALMEVGTYEGFSLNAFPIYLQLKSPETWEVEIRKRFSEQLLTFICIFPSMLVDIGNEEQELLAYLLCSSMDCTVAISSIANETQKLINSSDKSEMVKFLALKSFYDSLTLRKNQNQNNNFHNWRRIAQLFITSLGFDSALIILDTNEINKHILSSLYQWADYKLIIKLFTMQEESYWHHQYDVISLKWSNTQLQTMAEWRLGSISRFTNTHLRLSMFFEENLYETFIESALGSPRQLAQLWQALFTEHLQTSPQNDKFTLENWQQVEKMYQAMENSA